MISGKRSGLQKEVFSLYRRALRLITTKPARAQPRFRTFIRWKFHNNAQALSPRDISAIEHLLRLGKRQVEQLENPAVKDCSISKEMQNWEARNPVRR